MHRSPSFLGRPSTSISKTVSSKIWCRRKFGGSVERRPLEEHEPTYTTSAKPLSSSPSPSRPDVPLFRPRTHAFSSAVIEPSGHPSREGSVFLKNEAGRGKLWAGISLTKISCCQTRPILSSSSGHVAHQQVWYLPQQSRLIKRALPFMPGAVFSEPTLV